MAVPSTHSIERIESLAQMEKKQLSTTPEEELRQRIAKAAYYKAEKRGFTPGQEQDDWVEAEKEIQNTILDP